VIVAVATSGGRDSTALLHCTARQAAPLGIRVLALHVHHGLMPQADQWLAQVRQQSRRWGVGFDARHLQGRPARGESVEAWARAGRYCALTEMARAAGCALVLLAHHRRDQAETVLLQALRGAGPAGLSAMPHSALREGIVWARPWLNQPREAIDAYVCRYRLSHADDTSNEDTRFARSRLRRTVWPALSASFPEAELALAQLAQRAQEAAALSAEVAKLDLQTLAAGTALPVAAWGALSPARRGNALKLWLAQCTGEAVSHSLLQRLGHELLALRQGRWPLGQGELRLYRGQLQWAAAVTAAASEPRPLTVDLSEPGEWPLAGWAGRIVVARVAERGLASAALCDLLARARLGGDRFQLAPRSAARSLKKQYQAREVPAWGRGGPVLCAVDGQLLFAPGLGIDARHWAAPGTPQYALQWVPDARQPGR
jgi:tRNA(Ile)-lysidine synthase